MAVFERSTLVRAPLDEVWAFHTAPEGLPAAAPGWLHLAVESTVGPHGQPVNEFSEGTEVTLSIRPFGVVPELTWTARITAVERRDDRAVFRDEMHDGPFPRWVHTHGFAAEPEGTRLTDRVEYRLPLGPAGSLSALAWPGFEAIFAARHRRTKRLLE